MTRAMAAELRVARDGDDAHREMAEMVSFLRETTAPLHDGDPNASGMLMSALCFAAGTILGELIICDLASDQDKKRIVDSMAHNFRQGVTVGKRKAMRVAHETMGGGNA